METINLYKGATKVMEVSQATHGVNYKATADEICKVEGYTLTPTQPEPQTVSEPTPSEPNPEPEVTSDVSPETVSTETVEPQPDQATPDTAPQETMLEKVEDVIELGAETIKEAVENVLENK